MLEPERREQLLEVAKRDRRPRIGEQAFVELVDAAHGYLGEFASVVMRFVEVP